MELFSFTPFEDCPLSGQITLVFSKRKTGRYNYSLSKRAELKFGAELIKMVMVTEKQFFPEHNQYLGPMTFSYEVEELKIDNEAELLKLFGLSGILE